MLAFVQTKTLSSHMLCFYKMWSFAMSELDYSSLIIPIMKQKFEIFIL